MRINMLFLFIVFMSMESQLHSQDSKFSIGLVGSMDNYIYNFKENDLDLLDVLYESVDNYSYGLRLEYRLKKNWSIRSGFLRSDKGFQHRTISFFGDPVDPNDIFIRELNVIFIDVPLILSYNFLRFGNSVLYASAGMTLSLAHSSKEISITYNNVVEQSQLVSDRYGEGFSRNLVFGEFDLGIKHNIVKWLSFYFESNLRLGEGIFEKRYLKSTTINYGFSLGVNFNF